MIKPLKSGVVNLNDIAKRSSLAMMEKLTKIDPNIKIDHSKLVSYIVVHYHEKYFNKNIKNIISFHRDSRKEIKSKLDSLTNAEIETLSKYLTKLKPNGDSNDK